MTDLRTHLNRLSRRASRGYFAARVRNCPITKGNYPITKLSNHPIPGEAGFTLIELTVVIALIIILASVGLAQYKNSVMYAKEAVLRDDLNKMREAIDQYYADKGKYPESLDSLVSDGYVRKLPDDPITKSSGSWQTVPAEPDPSNPTAQPGIYDVKSGSEASALDGSKYSDW
jgi:general secretion pathway protein G